LSQNEDIINWRVYNYKLEHLQNDATTMVLGCFAVWYFTTKQTFFMSFTDVPSCLCSLYFKQSDIQKCNRNL